MKNVNMKGDAQLKQEEIALLGKYHIASNIKNLRGKRRTNKTNISIASLLLENGWRKSCKDHMPLSVSQSRFV